MKHAGPIAGVLAVAGFATTGFSQDSAFIITRADVVPHAAIAGPKVSPHPGFVAFDPPRTEVGVIINPIYVEAAAVPEPVSETPALPHLATLQLAGTYILVDPDVNYLAERPGGIDESHSIVQAQRMWRELRPSSAYIVRRPGAVGEADPRPVGEIRPSAVLLKPDFLDKSVPPGQQPGAMPMTPAPPKQTPEKSKQMAAAE